MAAPEPVRADAPRLPGAARHGWWIALVAVVNGGLNVAIASGGPGTGNGVVGGAAAFVLGLIASAIGWLALARRRTASESHALWEDDRAGSRSKPQRWRTS